MKNILSVSFIYLEIVYGQGVFQMLEGLVPSDPRDLRPKIWTNNALKSVMSLRLLCGKRQQE